MGNCLVIIQARSTSTRLPGKVLMELKGKPVLQHCVDNVKKTGIPFIIAIPKDDKPLIKYCNIAKLPYYEGSENDVLDRYYRCAKAKKAKIICRITSDCWAILPETIYFLSALALWNNIDFISNTFRPFSTFEGNDCEVMSYRCLSWLHKVAKEDLYKQHVTNYIYEHKEEFDKTGMIRQAHNWSINLSNMKTSIDTEKDFLRAKEMII
jgi:spore coat polysaccharide biosynthesis protein SpsF